MNTKGVLKMNQTAFWSQVQYSFYKQRNTTRTHVLNTISTVAAQLVSSFFLLFHFTMPATDPGEV